MKLAELLRDKNLNLFYVNTDAHITFIYDVMKSNRVHHLAVMKGPNFLGLIDQESLLDAIMISPQNFNSLEANDIMRRHIPPVLPDHSVEDVVKVMKEKNLQALPYFDEHNACQTLITRTDLLRLVHDKLIDFDPDTSILEKAKQKGDMAMVNPVVRKIVNMLSDIGI